MDFLNTTKPISVIAFTKMNYPKIDSNDLVFLNKWRDSITNNNLFTGWSTIADVIRKTRLLNCAKEYTEYLYDWAMFKESLSIVPDHITDDNDGKNYTN